MILNVKRKDILAVVKKVARIAPSISSMEELKGILLELDDRAGTIRMTSTNFEVAIRAIMPASIEKGGSIVVEAGLFQDILSLLPNDNVYMELRPRNQLYIRSGSAHYQIAAIPGERYPKVEIPMPGDTVSVTGIKSLVGNALFAVPKSKSTNPIFNCINLNFSMDGLRASAGSPNSIVQIAGDKESVGQLSVLVPASTLKLLASLSHDSDVYDVGITGAGDKGKEIVFFDGTMVFSARLMEGSFMDIDKVFSLFTPATIVQINADVLKTALGNISVFAGSGDTIAIIFHKNGLELKCETENGNSTTRVDAFIQNPPSKEFHLNANRFADCIGTLDGSITLCFSAEGNLAIQTGKMRYLQPASRPRQKKKVQTKEEKVAA